MASALRYVLLNNGKKMPRLGLGTYCLTGDNCADIVDKALHIGYRHIDTAQTYLNEQDIGDVLLNQEKNNRCMRKDVFITTKLAPYNMKPTVVKRSLEESLEKLKTRYVDLFLIHLPWALNKPHNNRSDIDYAVVNYKDTWREMEKIVKDGMAKSIGLSNFTEKQITSVLSVAKIVPQNVQLECHLYYQQEQLRRFLSKHNISYTAYSPLGARGRPERHVTLENKHAIILEEPIVTELAKKYKVSPALILLRYLIQMNMVVVAKTGNLSRLEENYKVLDVELETADCEKLKVLDRGIRFFVFHAYKNHPLFPQPNESF